MKKLTILLYFSVALLMLVGCAGNTNEDSTADSSDNNSAIESKEGDASETDERKSIDESDDGAVSDSTENRDVGVDTKEKENSLSGYSAEQIEYARVWLQLGPNQAIEELNVNKIPAGTAINPNDETSAVYPIDVIQLAGSRLVDGSVTYSGNGDGSINVYNVPLRWETNVPEDLEKDYMSKYTQSIIDDAELIYVDPGNNEEIRELIEIQTID